MNVTAGAAGRGVTQPATPIVSAPGSTVNTSITCTASNVAPNSTAIAPTCGATAVDSTGASVPVTIGTCTPALPLGTLAAGATIVCPVSYVTPGTAGGTDTTPVSVTLTATTSATNDSTAANNTEPVTRTIIDAVNDSSLASRAAPWVRLPT
ncbi:MAG: hypothetical protein IPH40_09645 [Polaromonas sp.]|nr:hypothetical protein [Polaromonas sp.]